VLFGHVIETHIANHEDYVRSAPEILALATCAEVRARARKTPIQQKEKGRLIPDPSSFPN